MGHIFISYSHKDKKYVEKLEKKLVEEGFDVWIDHRIDYGAQWPKEIQKALDTCDAFIVIVSENAYKSKWVQNEVARADRKGKPFFPLLLEGDAWLVIEAFQYVDVRDGSLPPTRFYEHLRGYLAYVETPSSHFLRQKNITNDLLTKNKILGEDDRKQKTVTFLFYGYERNFDTDSFICTIIFSVISTELIGTPYEVAKTYRFQISLTSRLMSFWNIPNALELGQNKISDEMIKIALQSAEEYISLLIRSGEILDDRLQPWNRTTENSPETCPYNLANVDYPKKMSFVVELADFPGSNGENIRKMKDEIEGLKKKLNKVESAQPKRNPLQPRPGQKDVGWNIKK